MMRVLIADDDIVSLLMLQRLLEKWDYEVTSCQNGTEAWQAFKSGKAPQLAVLDWMMPGIDGVELCRRIRKRNDVGYVYIILLTAKGQKHEIAAGFEAGADDYVVKPFDREELRIRVAVGSRIVEYEAALAEKNATLERYASEMEELATERSNRLLHAEKMATIGLLSAGIAHEINNPTSFISGNAQTQAKFWNELEPILQQRIARGEGITDKLEFILQEMPKTISGIRNGVRRIHRIVKGLETLSRQQQAEPTLCDVNSCIQESLMFCQNALKNRVTVKKKLATPLPQIMADVQQIQQVLVNLLINAADALEDRPQGTLTISTQHMGNSVVIVLEDNGPGIQADNLDDIWQPFFTTKPPGKGTGLGLSIVHGIIESHRGRISAENKPDGGARFTITLPVSSQGG